MHSWQPRSTPMCVGMRPAVEPKELRLPGPLYSFNIGLEEKTAVNLRVTAASSFTAVELREPDPPCPPIEASGLDHNPVADDGTGLDGGVRTIQVPSFR